MSVTRFFSASLVIALAACSGTSGPYGGGDKNPPPPPPPPPANTVNASSSLAFTPSSLTVTAGETVTFAIGSVAHTVTFDDRNAATPNDIADNANVSIQRTFSTAGTYNYHCTIHPFMTGKVVVR